MQHVYIENGLHLTEIVFFIVGCFSLYEYSQELAPLAAFHINVVRTVVSATLSYTKCTMLCS